MDLLECAVCMGDMTDRSPRSLLCLHCFCTQCLSQLVKNNKITCPTCRKVTQLKSGNVNELAVDFKLAHFKDAMKKEVQSPDLQAKIKPKTCDICNGNQGSYQCKDCPQIFCGPCRVKHDGIGQFKSHTILELCMKHQHGVTYMCKKCVLPLCMKCMLLEHANHEKYFIPYTEGKEEKQKEANLLKDDIKHVTNQTKGKKELQEKLKQMEHMRKSFQSRKEVHLQKAAEIDRYMEESLSHEKQIENLISGREVLEAESVLAMASLNSLMTDSGGFCERYNKVRQKAVETRDRLNQACEEDYSLPAYDVAKPCECDVVTQRAKAEIRPPVLPVKNLKVEKLMWHIKPSDAMKVGNEIAIRDNDIFVINHKKPERIECMDIFGKILEGYRPEAEGKIKGLDVYQDNLFILQDRVTTKISLSDPKKSPQKYNHGITSTDGYIKMLVKDNNTLYLSDRSSGKIYQYDHLSQETKIVVQDLKLPWFISIIEANEENYYAVSHFSSDSIQLYNEKWELKHRLPNLCNLSWATAITNMNTFLLADNWGNQISHYTMDGKLLTHVVTQNDGLRLPQGIAYKYPYVYVCRETDYLKCYKLKYH